MKSMKKPLSKRARRLYLAILLSAIASAVAGCTTAQQDQQPGTMATPRATRTPFSG